MTDIRRVFMWATFLFAATAFACAWFVGSGWIVEHRFWVGGAASAMLYFGLGSLSALLEPGFLALAWILFSSDATQTGPLTVLPLVGTFLTLMANPLESRIAALLTVAVTLLWADLPHLLSGPKPAVEFVYFALTMLGLAVFIGQRLLGGFRAPQHIDAVVASYSGNTAHFAQAFFDAAESLGVKVDLHRHHLVNEPDPELKGDALVLAFPTMVWCTPWTLYEYLLFRLPPGRGKPAFIIYTAGGGPENAHLYPWLILTLKGYRVMGRMWAVYPLNVALMRLGPASLWHFLDGLLPRGGDVRLLERSARSFCRGEPAGMPLIIWPFFIAAIAPLFYNRLVNRIYKSYAFKKRCNHCGRCIRFCPTKRLSLDERGLPRSSGTCLMCYGCVNECLTKAAQLLLLSEIGQPYRSRWRKFIYRRRPKEAKRRALFSPE